MCVYIYMHIYLNVDHFSWYQPGNCWIHLPMTRNIESVLHVITGHGISINIFNCCHIFCGCVPEAVAPSYALGFIYITERWVSFPLLLCSLLIWANNSVYYGPTVAFLFASSPSIWDYWTSTMLVGYILSCVCLRLNDFSLNYLSCIIRDCVYSDDRISCDD